MFEIAEKGCVINLMTCLHIGRENTSLMHGGQRTCVVHTYVYDRRIVEELGTNTPDNKFIVCT